MKTAMCGYFIRLLQAWEETDNTLPMTVRLDEAEPFIYVGEENKDGWIQWKPLEKELQYDFAPIEEELKVNLHVSIKEYYNSYWFCTLGGAYREYSISLDPVIPGVAFNDFNEKLRGYKREHNGKLEKIPIGLEAGQDLLVVVDNETGQLLIEDHDRGIFEMLATSLEELICHLQV